MRQRLALLSALGVVGLLAACTGNVSLGRTPGASSLGNTAADGGGANSADGSSATGPYGITCRAFWRASGTAADLTEQKFQFRSDAETTHQTLTFPDRTLDFDYAPATDNAAEGDLSVTVPESRSRQVYRLSKNRTPVNQFVGGFGFTGLIYANGLDLQYICEADGAAAPTHQPIPVSMNAVCQVELRTTPGGAVERRETFEIALPLATGQTFSKKIDYDDQHLEVIVEDDPEDARAMHVNLTRGNGTPTALFSQLLQLDRNATLYNQLAGTTFTGRVAIGLGTEKELSCACSARSSATGSNGSTPATCDDLAKQAYDRMNAFLESHRTCTQASDCVQVELNSTAFDACERMIASSAVDGFNATRADVDAHEGAQFQAQGCKLIAPPCAGPVAPACVNNQCQ